MKTHLMKTYHLILFTTVLFVVLFYGETPGVNLGILGIVYAVLALFATPEKNKTQTFYILFVTSILSSIAFAWYRDFPSLLAVVASLLFLGFKSKTRKLKTLFIVPVFVTNFFTFFCRFFSFEKWLPKFNTSGMLQKTIAIILIPAIFIIVFFCIYTYGSDHFATLFDNIEFDFNFLDFFGLAVLGFFIAFNFWNFSVDRFIYKQNHYLNNTFSVQEKPQKPSFSFMTFDLERTSGIITFLVLNIMLVFFIFTYNYEQFYEAPKTPSQLSDETHERVVSVIFSIIMAIAVIMFYFKGAFNFDKNAGILKMLAKIWVVLNAVLIFSAMAKNTEYVQQLGLTYKRLGVYAFLILSIIGLVVTFIKIQKQKTNAFLFNQMLWYFYGMILVCSYFNWGGMATQYNIRNHKGNFEFLHSLNYNDEMLEQAFPKEMKTKINDERTESNKATFLSKILYYESIKK
ncbi:DUF4153 domain-containing protein [Chryseobacterium geocarposphaerae]|uniref:Uncharacterized protein DUF4173 n=1 Tax=Chryseobacterium geocarposphaerae TaxID=1416776 RepID=A0A2M9C0V1_9FLAO|nr:DUF4173 domain-containing protein [Chryseobacterium geocarposphaerae]PJJ64018.1 uncharacterized protein DUF4173 [Chryseobacterium geocarposphaerae]